MFRIRAAGPTALLFAFLSACGGGGDSGGAGGGGGSGGGQTLQLSTTQINFAAGSTGSTPAAATLSGTVSGNPSAVYATVTVTTNGVEFVSTPTVSGSSASMNVVARFPGTLGHGTFTDTITVRACRDAACNSQYAGSPATVNVTYRIGLEVTPATINRTAVEGATVPAQTLNLAYYPGSGNWTAAVNYASGAGWLSAPASGSTLPTGINAAFGSSVAPGTYNATLVLQASAAGALTETRNIPVTYVVQPLLQVGAVTEFSATNTQAPAGQTRTVTVGSNDAARNTAWTATVQPGAPWLQLTTASGTTGGTSSLAMTLVPSEVAKLPNGRYLATVAVDPADAAATTVNVPVVLNLDRSFVATVAPYVAGSNRQAEVYLRGERFDSGTVTEVRFGNAAAIAFTRDSATRIRATHPALAAGRYPVTVFINGSVIGSAAELVVQDAGNYAAAGERVIAAAPGAPLPFFAGAFEFDPERRACYLATTSGTTQNPPRLVRLRADAGSWSELVSPIDFAPFTFITGLTLSADGKTLFVGAGHYVLHLDPVTLTEIRRVQLSQPSPTPTLNSFAGGYTRLDDGTLAFLNQNAVLSIYRPWDDAVSTVNLQYAPRGLRANGTGNKLLVGASFAQGGGTGYDVFDTHTRALGSGLRPYTNNPPVSDRFGDRWAVTLMSAATIPIPLNNILVVNESGTELGRTANVERIDMDRLLTADGRVLFVQTRNGGGSDVYRAFDVSMLPTVVTGGESPARFGDGARYLTPTEDEIVTCGAEYVTASATP